jgi:hypothetical protein
MKLEKIASQCFSNVVIVSALGQVPPFTALPEEIVSIPVAIGLGLLGVDIFKEVSKVVK